MWDTRTTEFNIMNTPYGQDIVKQYVDACRKQGLAVGFYFSPEDFHFLYREGEVIRRTNIEDIPAGTRERYIELVKQQCGELLTGYGPIDVIFFDMVGGKGFLIDALKPFCWEINPDLLITRGEISTPEQHLAEKAAERVHEVCMTMGTQWHFKPTNEDYKTGGEIIRLLVETRAKGGALLMNVGPDAFGELPFEQERILTELAAWHFINAEAVTNVRPWVMTNDKDIWYTHNREENILYAVLFGQKNWGLGERREFLLQSVMAGEDTEIGILSQSDVLVEYKPDIDPKSRFEQTREGLLISVVRAQRIYNNREWPNAVVVKLKNIRSALTP
jgi:alpha-L-fucosidase